jgi:hypothetical protein
MIHSLINHASVNITFTFVEKFILVHNRSTKKKKHQNIIARFLFHISHKWSKYVTSYMLATEAFVCVSMAKILGVVLSNE